MTAEERSDVISSCSGLFSSAIELDGTFIITLVMSETLPINAVARANGVRLMIYFFPFPFEQPLHFFILPLESPT
jgi:hypothetical protein